MKDLRDLKDIDDTRCNLFEQRRGGCLEAVDGVDFDFAPERPPQRAHLQIHQPSEGKQIAFFKYTSSSALPCDFLLFAVHIVVHILV